MHFLTDKQRIEWDLTPLYESYTDPRIERTFKQVDNLLNGIEAQYRGKINVPDFSVEKLLAVIQRIEEVWITFEPLFIYGNLAFLSDIRKEELQQLFQRVQIMEKRLITRIDILETELGRFINTHPDTLLNPQLIPYKGYLELITAKASHTLSALEEELIAEKAETGILEWYNLFLEWRNTREIILGDQKLSLQEIVQVFSSSDRIKRQEAITSVLSELVKYEKLFARCMRNIYSSYTTDTRRRGFKSVLHPSLLLDRISHETVKNLFAAIDQHISLYQEFLKMKARVLGIEKLSGEDVSNLPIVAPLPETEANLFTWEEMQQIIVTTSREFDPDFGKITESLFKQNRVDASPRPGRSPHGVTMPWYGEKSAYVMVLTDQGNITNFLLLTHELGHAIHCVLSSQQQKYLCGSLTTLQVTLAELASEFNTRLVATAVLQKISDSVQKRTFLMTLLEDIFTMIFVNGGLRFRFQEGVHAALEKGEYLSASKISSIYQETRNHFYGDTVNFLPNQHKVWTWMRLFYLPSKWHFYNYQYAFGELLVSALYNTYKSEGSVFVPKYKRLLQAGSSRDPSELIKDIFGFDITQAEFWNLGFHEIQLLMDELRLLIE